MPEQTAGVYRPLMVYRYQQFGVNATSLSKIGQAWPKWRAKTQLQYAQGAETLQFLLTIPGTIKSKRPLIHQVVHWSLTFAEAYNLPIFWMWIVLHDGRNESHVHHVISGSTRFEGKLAQILF